MAEWERRANGPARVPIRLYAPLMEPAKRDVMSVARYVVVIVLAISASAFGQGFQNERRAAAWNLATLHARAICQSRAIAAGCARRWYRVSADSRKGKWRQAMLPPYVTIVELHEKHFRQLVTTPLIYDEVMIASTKFAATEADAQRWSAKHLRQFIDNSIKALHTAASRESLLYTPAATVPQSQQPILDGLLLGQSLT